MPAGARVLVQPQITGSIELIAGLIHDPQFGPCVMLGLGGILTEALNDSAFAVAPLSRQEALELIGRIRSQHILNGFRGAAPVNRDMLAEILMHLGQIGLCCPRIQEIDINPMIVSNGTPIAVDAAIILAAPAGAVNP
jgi:acetyltransferase